MARPLEQDSNRSERNEATGGMKRQREQQNCNIGGILFQCAPSERTRSDGKKKDNESPAMHLSPFDSLLQERGFGHLKPRRGESLLRSTSSESTIPTTSRASVHMESLHKEEEPIEAELVAKNKSSPLGRVSSSPSFSTMASSAPTGLSEPSLLFTVEEVQQADTPLSPTQPRLLKKTRKCSLSYSVSAPNLHRLDRPAELSGLGSRSGATHAPAENCQNKTWAPPKSTINAVDRFTNTNPEQFLRQIIESHGLPYKTYSSLSLGEAFYLPVKPENVAGYTQELITAVHNEDLETLERIYKQQNGLQCCNKFGESIVHAACRKSSVALVKFLLEHGVSLRVCDDYGRNCLHDACWAPEARPDLVKLLIEICPDLLFCKDRRGFTPLSYVRRKDWGMWCQFLEQHRELVMGPRELP